MIKEYAKQETGSKQSLHWLTCTGLHLVTSMNTALFIVTAVITSITIKTGSFRGGGRVPFKTGDITIIILFLLLFPFLLLVLLHCCRVLQSMMNLGLFYDSLH
jgi:hypothetical protein